MKLLRRFRYWLQHSRRDAELAEEMRFHRDMLAASGSPPAAMGNATLAGEDARAVWSLWQDLAYGIRAMRREPGFTLTALLELGSAIGVNTSLFTIFDASP